MSKVKSVKKSNKQLLSTFALIAVAIIWGTGFIATDVLIDANWSTPQIMATRFSIASLAMLIVVGKKIKETTKKEIVSGAIAGVFLFLAFYSQTLGQAFTTVSNTAFFTATNVVMIPFIRWVVTRKRPTIQTILLSVLALAGIAVLSFTNGAFSLNRGDWIILLCALFFALHISYLEKAGQGTDATRINFFQTSTAAVLSIVVLGISTGFNQAVLPNFSLQDGILAAVYLGLFSTCLAYFLQTSAQQHVNASVTGVILSLEGLFGSLFSVVLRLEPFTWTMLIGGTMIILATILMGLVPNSDNKEMTEKTVE